MGNLLDRCRYWRPQASTTHRRKRPSVGGGPYFPDRVRLPWNPPRKGAFPCFGHRAPSPAEKTLPASGTPKFPASAAADKKTRPRRAEPHIGDVTAESNPTVGDQIRGGRLRARGALWAVDLGEEELFNGGMDGFGSLEFKATGGRYTTLNNWGRASKELHLIACITSITKQSSVPNLGHTLVFARPCLLKYRILFLSRVR